MKNLDEILLEGIRYIAPILKNNRRNAAALEIFTQIGMCLLFEVGPNFFSIEFHDLLGGKTSKSFKFS